MKRKLDKKVFAKYYWGIATDQEKNEVYQSQESERVLQEHWSHTTNNMEVDLNKDDIARKISAQIKKNTKESRIKKLKRIMLKHAASFIIPILALGILYFLLVMRPDMINRMATVEKENPRGQRTELILPDGSKVWLNAQSKISFPEKFIGRYRIIQLEGEAYFDVVRNPKKPFIVQTKEVDIEVLGTSFNVKSYSEDEIVKTTLISGKVRVKHVDPKTEKVLSAVLSPNHQAIYLKNDKRFVLNQVEAQKYILWKDGIISFDNEPFTNVVKTLERWYDIDFEVDSDLKHKYNYTITITEESLEDVLALIKKTTPKITIKYSKDKVIISE